MSEHPQQTDRVLRDTRILTLRIWAVVGCIVIAAVIFNLMGILAPVIEFLAVGSIIAFVMSPITNWLEHHGVNRGIGSLHMTQSAVKSHNGPADRLQSVGGACR